MISRNPDAGAYGIAKGVVELHRETGSLDGTQIFQDTVRRGEDRSLERRDYLRERERRGTRCFPRERFEEREPLFFPSHGTRWHRPCHTRVGRQAEPP